MDWSPATWQWIVWVLLIVSAVAQYFSLQAKSRDDLQKKAQIAVMQSETAAANERAGTANQLAAQAHERAEQLEREAAIYREKAAATERDLLTVRHQLSPRRLSGAQRAALVKSLEGLRGYAVVGGNAFDGEATDFGVDIEEAIRGAGWTVYRVGYVSNHPGVIVHALPGAGAARSTRVVQALRGIGISAEPLPPDVTVSAFTLKDGFQDGIVYVGVGRKPPLGDRRDD